MHPTEASEDAVAPDPALAIASNKAEASPTVWGFAQVLVVCAAVLQSPTELNNSNAQDLVHKAASVWTALTSMAATIATATIKLHWGAQTLRPETLKWDDRTPRPAIKLHLDALTHKPSCAVPTQWILVWSTTDNLRSDVAVASPQTPGTRTHSWRSRSEVASLSETREIPSALAFKTTCARPEMVAMPETLSSPILDVETERPFKGGYKSLKPHDWDHSEKDLNEGNADMHRESATDLSAPSLEPRQLVTQWFLIQTFSLRFHEQ